MLMSGSHTKTLGTDADLVVAIFVQGMPGQRQKIVIAEKGVKGFTQPQTADIVETRVKKAAVALKGLQAAADLGMLFQNRDFESVFGQGVGALQSA